MNVIAIVLAAVFLIWLIYRIASSRKKPTRDQPSAVGNQVSSPTEPAAIGLTSSPPRKKLFAFQPFDPRDVELNEKFQLALDLIEKGENLFITGRAGTGKSTLLQYVRARMDGPESPVVVLSFTGIAAVNVGGQTIHSFFRFPLSEFLEAERIEAHFEPVSLVVRAMQTLIIDEVSMVRADIMDCIDKALRTYRRNGEAFGGVQIIFIGDLYQLPPVVKGRDVRRRFAERYGSPYSFRADAFRETHVKLLELEKVYRQTDTAFLDLLNKIREARLHDGVLDRLNSRVRPIEAAAEQGYVTLTPRNDAASRINRECLNRLPGKELMFPATVTGDFDDKPPTDEPLRLKSGAQVIMLRNDPQKRWVNGSIGFVCELSTGRVVVDIGGFRWEVERCTWAKTRYVFNPEDNTIAQEIVGSFTQYPLRLAWALTINKSQGQTFQQVYLDLGRGAFDHGQTYVALSRCPTLEGLALARPILPGDVIVKKEAVDYQGLFERVTV